MTAGAVRLAMLCTVSAAAIAASLTLTETAHEATPAASVPLAGVDAGPL